LWTEIVKNAAALDPTLLKLAFVFVLIGFGTKAGIFPMHAWLPDAHSEAPSPVSALLSGVLLNCALFVIIRFAIILNNGIGPQFTQNIFLVFGALSVAAAALLMYMQKDIKRLLAYSSVENIGLIVLALGIGGPAGVLAALFHAVNHSLVKAMLFCASGNILLKYHSRDLGRIRGLLRAAPFSGLLLLAGGLALVGSPPFNIFLSKFSIITAGMYSGYLWLMVVMLLFLAVIFAAFLRVISSAVFGDLPEDVRPGELRLSMLAPVAVLLVLIVALGLFMPPQLGQLLNQATLAATNGASMAGAPAMFGAPNRVGAPEGLLQLGKLFTP
jgi:hydrogenase-4 component F